RSVTQVCRVSYGPWPLSLLFQLRRLPPQSTLFPYTTLFRSEDAGGNREVFVFPVRARAEKRLVDPSADDFVDRFRILDLVRTRRSEEHTSELQSREKLVCRLLLEKKKESMPWTSSSSDRGYA